MYTTAVHARRTTVSLWRNGAKARKSRRRRLARLSGSDVRRNRGGNHARRPHAATRLGLSLRRARRSLARRPPRRSPARAVLVRRALPDRPHALPHPASFADLRALLRPRLRPRPRAAADARSSSTRARRARSDDRVSGHARDGADRAGGSTRCMSARAARCSSMRSTPIDLHAFCVDIPQTGGNVYHPKLELRSGRLAVLAGTKRLAASTPDPSHPRLSGSAPPRSRPRSRATTSTMSRFALKIAQLARRRSLPRERISRIPSSSRSAAELARVRLEVAQGAPDQLRDRHAVPPAGGEIHHRRLEPVAGGQPLVLGREDPVVRRDLLALVVALASSA